MKTTADSCGNFNFRLIWRGRVVAGFSDVSGIGDGPDSESNSVRKLPGLTKFTAITLKRGVIHDPEFLKWASNVAGTTSLARESVHLALMDERGKEIITYRLRHSWISKYEGPTFNTSGNEVAIESMTLENEGYETDEKK